MSKKGGYVIVDLKGQSITAGTPFTLDGVTARLDRAKNKACLLSGFAIGDEEKRDLFVDLQPTADGYAGIVGEYQITIEDDEIIVTEKSDGYTLYKHSINTNEIGYIIVISSRKDPYNFNSLKKAFDSNSCLLYPYKGSGTNTGIFHFAGTGSVPETINLRKDGESTNISIKSVVSDTVSIWE